MGNAESLLKPGGRIVIGDVCDNTSLSKHFNTVVTLKCLTSHTTRWLSKESLRELIANLPRLSLIKAEMKTRNWIFSSKREVAIFFKSLRAYPLPEKEVTRGLQKTLSFEEKDGQVILNWPMLFLRLLSRNRSLLPFFGFNTVQN